MPSRLIEFLEDRAGDLHRGTICYEGDEIAFAHLREDLNENRIRDQIEGMLARLQPEGTEEEDVAFFHLGDLEATVRVFERAVVLHFPMETNRGVIVSLEATAARELNTFIGECQRRLED